MDNLNHRYRIHRYGGPPVYHYVWSKQVNQNWFLLNLFRGCIKHGSSQKKFKSLGGGVLPVVAAAVQMSSIFHLMLAWWKAFLLALILFPWNTLGNDAVVWSHMIPRCSLLLFPTQTQHWWTIQKDTCAATIAAAKSPGLHRERTGHFLVNFSLGNLGHWDNCISVWSLKSLEPWGEKQLGRQQSSIKRLCDTPRSKETQLA